MDRIQFTLMAVRQEAMHARASENRLIKEVEADYDDIQDGVITTAAPLSRSKYNLLRDFIDCFQRLAVGVKRGALDKDIVVSNCATHMCRVARSWRPHIEASYAIAPEIVYAEFREFVREFAKERIASGCDNSLWSELIEF